MFPKLLSISIIAALTGFSLSGCGGGGDTSGAAILPSDLMMTFDLPIDGGAGKVMFATTSFNDAQECLVYTNKIVYAGNTTTPGSTVQITGNYQVTGFNSSTGVCSYMNVKWMQPVSSTDRRESSITMYDCVLPVSSIKDGTGSVGRWDSLLSYKTTINGVEAWPYEQKGGTGGVIYRGYDSGSLK